MCIALTLVQLCWRHSWRGTTGQSSSLRYCSYRQLSHRQITWNETDEQWQRTLLQTTATHAHAHTVLRYIFQDHLGEPLPEENLLLDFIVQGKTTRGRHTNHPMGATPSVLISDPLRSSPIFTPDALPAASPATLPFYRGLGQAPNILPCIPSGVVHEWYDCNNENIM